jgi:MFS family permease
MTTSWPRIWLLYAIGVLAAAQLGIVPPLVPALQQDLDLSLATAGLAVSAITLVGALVGLPAGAWCEKLGHARAGGIGLLIMAAAAMLCAAAHDAVLLLAARGLAGIGYLLVVVAGPSLMATTAQPQHQPVALSLWSTFVPVGIALSGVATATVADAAGWRLIFAADSALLAIAMIIGALVFARTPATRATTHGPAQGWLPAALPLALSFFCFALLFLALAGILPAYLVADRGVAASTAGTIVAAATACGIVGSFGAGWMMRRGTAPGRLVGIGLGASTLAAVLAFSAAPGLPFAVTGFAVSFAIGGLVPAAVFASVPRIAPDRRAIGPINGLLAQAGSLGSLAGPPVLALWIEWAGWSLAPLLLLVVAALGSAAAFAVSRR